MKATPVIVFGVLFGYMVVAQEMRAQTPDIVSFHGNGNLTWTNSNSNLFYQVQWAASLTGTSPWQSNYTTLRDVRSTNASVSVAVPMFYRVSATSNRTDFPSPVAKSGQNTSLPEVISSPGSDGVLQKGVAWPIPRFRDQGNGTVMDNLTGLIWTKDAAPFGFLNWSNALVACNTLNSGEHGLTDGSVEGDWRLPNVKEVQSLIAWQYYDPPICNTTGTTQATDGDPFTSIQSEAYWTSSAVQAQPLKSWGIFMRDGGMTYGDRKNQSFYVWPVRDAGN